MSHKTLFVFLLVLVGAFSCSTKKETPSGQSEMVESLSFEGTGGSRELVFSTDEQWEASSVEEWCRIYPSSGSGRILKDHVITVVCDPNEGPDDRGCFIIVRTPTQSVHVQVYQGTQTGFYLPETEIRVSTAAQAFPVSYSFNEPVSIELSEECEPWLQMIPSTRSMTPATLMLSVSENRSAKRTGTISFVSNHKSETVTIVQVADDIPIPDDSFRYHCLQSFDLDGDGHISRNEAEAARELSLFYSYRIWSVSGMEYFTGLERIKIYFDNHIANLDFRPFKHLRSVFLDDGLFDMADFTQNDVLSSIVMYDCQCPDPLNATGLTALTTLSLTRSSFEHIFLKGCTGLKEVVVAANNAIQELDLSDAVNLQTLNCLYDPNLKTVYLKAHPEKLEYDPAITTIVYVE